MNLLTQKCKPCEVGGNPMEKTEIDMYLKDLPTWILGEDDKKINKKFRFKDFRESMIFVNKIADLAESEGHHPDIEIVYDQVSISLTTHAVKGLSLNDFILATKIEKIS